MNPSSSNTRVGDQITLRATVTDTRGSVMSGRNPVWASSNTRVATVNNGEVRAIGEGTVSIVATVDGRADTASITVAPVAVGSIVVSPSTNILNTQEVAQLDARVTDENGNQIQRTVTWSSNTPTVARVSASGRVTAVSSGSATITASVDGRQATSSVTVRAAESRQPDPPANDPAADRRQIESLVEQYRAAIQGKNISGLRRIYPNLPSVDETNFRNFFDGVDDLTVQTDINNIDLQGDAATVRVDVQYTYRAGGRQETDFVVQMNVARQGSGWQIVRLESSQ